MSDILANYKYNSQIRLKNAQKAEHVFEIRLIILRKTLVLRNDGGIFALVHIDS